MSVLIFNIAKGIEIAHKYRRMMRDQEMQPYDEIVAKQIPGQAAKAEQERAKIRTKYTVMQERIDRASNEEELRAILDGEEPAAKGKKSSK